MNKRLHFLWYLKGVLVFSELCVCTLLEILPKLNFESDLQGRNQAGAGCWHNYLISISKWNWYSLSPRNFHFQNLKMCSPVNQIIPSDLCPRLGWKKDEGDSWHNYQAFTSYWRGGKWGERKPNFISPHLPQYLSAQGWCWISRKSKHMWAIRAF